MSASIFFRGKSSLIILPTRSNENIVAIWSAFLGGDIDDSVTMPLKAAIIEHLDELTPAAQATQACNTIVKVRRASGGRTTTTLVGTNTDVLGTCFPPCPGAFSVADGPPLHLCP